jgi:hypothetical protein
MSEQGKVGGMPTLAWACWKRKENRIMPMHFVGMPPDFPRLKPNSDTTSTESAWGKES